MYTAEEHIARLTEKRDEIINYYREQIKMTENKYKGQMEKYEIILKNKKDMAEAKAKPIRGFAFVDETAPVAESIATKYQKRIEELSKNLLEDMLDSQHRTH